jgi:hypothetical protein
MALYPNTGRTMELHLNAVDRQLYEIKAVRCAVPPGTQVVSVRSPMVLTHIFSKARRTPIYSKRNFSGDAGGLNRARRWVQARFHVAVLVAGQAT